MSYDNNALSADTLNNDLEKANPEKARFLASLTQTETALFHNMCQAYMGKTNAAGVPLTASQAMRMAAYKVDVMKRQGIKVAQQLKITSVPKGWPAVEDKPEKVKRKAPTRRAAPGESEAEIQAKIVQFLKNTGWFVIRINSGAMHSEGRYFRAYILENNGRSDGFPDLIAMKHHATLLLEVKTATGKLEESQKVFAEQAQLRGVVVNVVRSVDDVRRIALSTGV